MRNGQNMVSWSLKSRRVAAPSRLAARERGGRKTMGRGRTLGRTEVAPSVDCRGHRLGVAALSAGAYRQCVGSSSLLCPVRPASLAWVSWENGAILLIFLGRILRQLGKKSWKINDPARTLTPSVEVRILLPQPIDFLCFFLFRRWTT